MDDFVGYKTLTLHFRDTPKRLAVVDLQYDYIVSLMLRGAFSTQSDIWMDIPFVTIVVHMGTPI